MTARIAITGIGPVTAIGVGKDEVWEGLWHKRSNVQFVKHEIGGEVWDQHPLAEVPSLTANVVAFDEPQFNVSAQAGNRDLLMLATAGRLALADSGLPWERMRHRCGLVLAHENPGVDEYTRQIWTALATHRDINGSVLSYIKDLYGQVAAAGYATHSFVLLQQLTKILRVHGPTLAVNNACASGLFALESAAQWIRSGHCDAMLVTAGDSPRLITRYLWLKATKSCAPDGIIRPFDRNRCGFVLGEGAGALLLENWSSAIRRRAAVYAEYVSGAFRNDAWKLSVPRVSPHFYGEAVEEALELAKVKAGDIDLLVPHGAGSPLHDRYEAEAITQVFGRNGKLPLITALKPYVGHTLAGCSVIETILTLLAIARGTVPATLNFATADPRLGLQPVTEHRSAEIRTWMKTATGFGGFHAACVFRQPEVAA